MHEVNWIAILVAGLVPMIVGALWYGPLFGKRWLALTGFTEAELTKDFNPLKTYGVSFLFALVTAWVLAQLLAASGGGGVWAAVHVTLLAVVGFVAPLGHQSVAFERRKSGLVGLNVAYNLVAIGGQAVVIALWR